MYLRRDVNNHDDENEDGDDADEDDEEEEEIEDDDDADDSLRVDVGGRRNVKNEDEQVVLFSELSTGY